MLKRITDIIKKMFGFDEKYSTEMIEDIQEVAAKPKHIYIENRGNKDRWLHLKCPSGCGDIISVNLMKSVYPYWVVTRNADHTITLSPSIDKTDGCRSHFFIRSSRIVWAHQLPHSA